MTSMSVPPHLPRTIGVIHLRALPGSPAFEGDIAQVASQAARDAEALADAGFDGVLVENFGDTPFEPGPVGSVTVAAMTRCALAVRVAAPTLSMGINVLRNDAEAALAVAIATGASFIRVNVHTGARLTDQGLVQGQAAHTLRRRRALCMQHIALLCDVDVKHSARLAPRTLREETEELVERGGADAVLVTGTGTGKGVAFGDLNEVLSATSAPVYVASGATEATLPALRRAYGIIVGSALRADGRPGGRIDLGIAKRFVGAFAESRNAREPSGTTPAPSPAAQIPVATMLATTPAATPPALSAAAFPGPVAFPGPAAFPEPAAFPDPAAEPDAPAHSNLAGEQPTPTPNADPEEPEITVVPRMEAD